MSRLDLVIFGATGYTGKHAVKELSQLIKKYPGLTWGIAGRSRDKLEKILQEVSNSIDEDISSIKTIVADVGDETSLRAMCLQARVLVNCCGPYRHYGEPVVKAAIDSKAHYVDVSGEPQVMSVQRPVAGIRGVDVSSGPPTHNGLGPLMSGCTILQFMELMQLKYNKAAREAGVYIISACGFDSIPVDLGVIFVQQNFEGTVNSVETYLSVTSTATSKTGSVVNYGTWESLVYGLAHHGELRMLRKKLHPSSLPPFQPKLKPRAFLHRREGGAGGWCLPFPGADASVAYRTQRHLFEEKLGRPAQVRTYVQMPSLLGAVGAVFLGALLYFMSKTSITRQLLLSFPALFTLGFISKASPSEEVGRNTTFALDLRAEGWPPAHADGDPPSKIVNARVTGVNPGYGMTVVALLLSALTVLTETDKIPHRGGVLTPGAAFKDTSLIGQLHENNVKFQIV